MRASRSSAGRSLRICSSAYLPLRQQVHRSIIRHRKWGGGTHLRMASCDQSRRTMSRPLISCCVVMAPSRPRDTVTAAYFFFLSSSSRWNTPSTSSSRCLYSLLTSCLICCATVAFRWRFRFVLRKDRGGGYLGAEFHDLVEVVTVGVDHERVRVAVDDVQVQFAHQFAGLQQDLSALGCQPITPRHGQRAPVPVLLKIQSVSTWNWPSSPCRSGPRRRKWGPRPIGK